MTKKELDTPKRFIQSISNTLVKLSDIIDDTDETKELDDV